MDLNTQFLRNELDYLATIEGYPFGIIMDNGNMNYLSELEIDKNGRLVCYMPHVDDYYYVSKRITCLPDNSSNWLEHLHYKDESGKLILFQKYLLDKYT